MKVNVGIGKTRTTVISAGDYVIRPVRIAYSEKSLRQLSNGLGRTRK